MASSIQESIPSQLFTIICQFTVAKLEAWCCNTILLLNLLNVSTSNFKCILMHFNGCKLLPNCCLTFGAHACVSLDSVGMHDNVTRCFNLFKFNKLNNNSWINLIFINLILNNHNFTILFNKIKGQKKLYRTLGGVGPVFRILGGKINALE